MKSQAFDKVRVALNVILSVYATFYWWKAGGAPESVLWLAAMYVFMGRAAAQWEALSQGRLARQLQGEVL